MAEEILVGFEDEAEKIIHQLIAGESSSKLDIVSIIGMPGSGKTALAKKIYNHPSVKRHFSVLAWCCVSQQYQERKLLLDILRDTVASSSSFSEFEELNDDDLGDLLRKSLKGKRYLVVLDDIWDIGAWNCVKYCFPDDNNGSRILVTSRMQSVALHAKSDIEPHFLRQLSDSESFELLERKLFPNEDYCPDEKLQIVLKKIAGNCKGLPHVILTCCGILATMEKERWEDFGEASSNDPSLLTDREGTGVTNRVYS